MKASCNFGHERFFTDVLPPGEPLHEVERNLEILRHLGLTVDRVALEIWQLPEDRCIADRFWEDHRLDSARVIAFGVGAAKGYTRWPYYGELIRLLVESGLQFTPLVFEGIGEEELVRRILAQAPSTVVLPKEMRLRAAAAVLSRCALFVGNNSGPIHIAAAVGLPVVEICCHPANGAVGHENDPARFGALALKKVVVRPKAFVGKCKNGCMEKVPHCIATISVDEVAARVTEAFTESRGQAA
jgi:heptosyltransferase-2